MTLRRFIARRLIHTVILILLVLVLNWVIFEFLPGTQAAIEAGAGTVRKDNFANRQRLLLAQYGLNQPYYVQFENYFFSMLTFRFGKSFQSENPVISEVVGSGRLFNTLLLVGSSTALAILIGVTLGVFTSKKRGGIFDQFWVTASLSAFSLPTFFVGTILIVVLGIDLRFFPTAGSQPFHWGPNPPPWIQQIIPRLQYLFLPAVTLTVVAYGGFLLLTRATMIETLGEDYIVTARAKGVSERSVYFHHALRNASLPIVTSSALAFSSVLGGAIITETLFSYDGMGRYLYLAVLAKDFPVMQAIFYILALSTILANFISDLAYGIFDPRVRYE